MNIIVASRMLVMLEETRPDSDSDDAYHIIQRLLRSEINRIEADNRVERSREEFYLATQEESLMGEHNLVGAIKKYRERTQMGLYDSKKAVEAGIKLLHEKQMNYERENHVRGDEKSLTELHSSKMMVPMGIVTSCGE
jgi:hypothetical protein